MGMSSKTLVFNTNDIMEISALAYQKLEQKYNSEFNNLCEKFISEITDIYKDSKQNKETRIKLGTDAFNNLKGEKKLTDVATDEFKKIADNYIKNVYNAIEKNQNLSSYTKLILNASKKYIGFVPPELKIKNITFVNSQNEYNEDGKYSKASIVLNVKSPKMNSNIFHISIGDKSRKELGVDFSKDFIEITCVANSCNLLKEISQNISDKIIEDSKVLYMNNDFLDSEYQQIKPSFSLEEPQKNKDKSLDLDI